MTYFQKRNTLKGIMEFIKIYRLFQLILTHFGLAVPSFLESILAYLKKVLYDSNSAEQNFIVKLLR